MRRLHLIVVISLLAVGSVLVGQQQAPKPRPLDEKPKGAPQVEKPGGSRQEGELPARVPKEATGVDAFKSGKKLDETPRKRRDETPKPGAVAETPRPRPGFEDVKPKPPQQDPEQPADRPRPQEAPRIAPITLLDLELKVDDAPLQKRVALVGFLAKVDAQVWALTDPKLRQSVRFRMVPADAAPLGFGAPRVAFELVANRMSYPTGPLEGIAIRQNGKLVYMSERIHDEGVLTPKERNGFQLKQLTKSSGRPVYEGPCRKVYDVPVQVSRGSKQLTLAPGKTGALTVNGDTYVVVVFTSRYSVEKECGLSFEDPIRHIEYALWRK